MKLNGGIEVMSNSTKEIIGTWDMAGLCNKGDFFQKVTEYLKDIEAEEYMLVAIDIEHFRFFNKLYGTTEGDKLLEHVARCIKDTADASGGIGGYLGTDNYAVLMPNKNSLLLSLKSDIAIGVRKFNNAAGFLPAFGVCVIDDTSVDAVTIYDRAMMALAHIYGNYSNRICYFVPEMVSKIEEELILLAEVQEAFDKEEFIFFIQPQCDISTGKIVGGESLVRWKHKTRGLIPPGVFIPTLEKNGFIADLDKYVWESVCKWLRSWMDRGYKPVPISINVSRIDIFTMDVAAYLKSLLEKYDIPSRYIKVEVTESAYAESDDKIIGTVKQLRDADFLVMMDDFGSGYSSLNMLKSVAVDVLKIDMRFLDINENEEEKGISILESVVNMARQLKIPIIVEGVETQKQEIFLQKLGCKYMQGYYYYKPMPVDMFEALISDTRNVDYDGIWCKQVEQMHVREFLDQNLFNDTMINNIIGATAFYEMYDNKIDITRVNEEYFKLAGIEKEFESDSYKKFWNHVHDDDRVVLYSIFEDAYLNPGIGAEGYIHYVTTKNKILWVHMKVFFLREKEGRKIFYSSLRDVSFLEQKKHEPDTIFASVEELSEKQVSRMEKYYGNLPCGFSVGKVVLDESSKPCDYDIIYANRIMARIGAGNMERLRYLGQRDFADSKGDMLDKAYRAAYFGETSEISIYSSILCKYLQFTFSQYEYGYVSCMMKDLTHSHIYGNALNNVLRAYQMVYYVHLQDNYCRMIYPDDNHLLERGNYEEMLNRHFAVGKIAKYDEENVRRFFSLEHLKRHLSTKDVAEYRYKRNVEGVEEGMGEEWCQVTFTINERVNGVPISAIFTIRSIESIMREKEDKKHQFLAETLTDMTDGFFIYNETGKQKVLYVSPQVLKIYGCKTVEEFRELTGGTFTGMLHPEDVKRVDFEISEQIKGSDQKLDYIKYRIIRKDGEVRWVDDCGHLEDGCLDGDCNQFYVFIADVTESMDEKEKQILIAQSRHFNQA
ncbi:MAG: EAL domain-containing protein [Lachnospiraceae bacterium]|nr:EAL domain-containing protein [Lachnospiraceae bacterium]